MNIYKIGDHYHSVGSYKNNLTTCNKDLNLRTESRTCGMVDGVLLPDPKLEEACPICFKGVIESIKKARERGHPYGRI